MNAANLPRFRVRWIVMAGALVLVLGAVLVFFFVFPRVPSIKSWRSDQLAKAAVRAMDAADWSQAHAKTISAYQLAPENPNALRAAARLNVAAGQPQALAFYRTLLATGQATGEDYLHYSDALLRAGSYPPFLAAVADAGNRLPGDPRIRLLLAQYAVVAGDWASVLKLLREILASDQAAPADKQVAAQILLSIPLPDGKELAARWILDQPAGESSRLLDRVLATSGVPEDLRRRAARVIEKLPGRSFEGRVEVAASRLRSQPGEKEQVFEDLRREAKSPEDKRALASFLVRAGENQRAIDLLPLAAARTRKDCFLVWLDASAGLGRWDEVMNTLKAGQNPLEPALRDLYIARCYEALGQEKSADIYFERAARTPTEDRDLLFYLAGYFNQRGRLPLAEIVLRRLTSDHMASRSAYESLLNIYRTHGNSSGMLGVLDDMRQRWPKDPAVANDRNYLLLLLDRDISRTLERSRLLELENPDLFPLKMTRALAFLRARRPGEGLKIFENSQIQFGQLLPGQKAILSALLQANGMTDAAAAVRNGLEKAQLLPEERALLEK